jgi:hypothetical protein
MLPPSAVNSCIFPQQGFDMRATPWFGRGILFAATMILAFISERFLFHATAEAAARGIALSTPLGATIVRVGFGGFPLASAIIAGALLVTGQLRRGLWFVAILFGTVLVVRIVSSATNGSLVASVPLILPEALFVALSIVTLIMGGRGREPRGADYQAISFRS